MLYLFIMVDLYKSRGRETFRTCQFVGMHGTPYSQATLSTKRFAVAAMLYAIHGLIITSAQEQNTNIFFQTSQRNSHCFTAIFMRIDNFVAVVQKFFCKMPQIIPGIPVHDFCKHSRALSDLKNIHLLKMPVIYTLLFLQGVSSGKSP